MLTAALIVGVVVILFVLGLVYPKLSHKAQGKNSKLMGKGERKGKSRFGKLGDFIGKGFEGTRKGGNKAARSGRSLRDKLPF